MYLISFLQRIIAGVSLIPIGAIAKWLKGIFKGGINSFLRRAGKSAITDIGEEVTEAVIKDEVRGLENNIASEVAEDVVRETVEEIGEVEGRQVVESRIKTNFANEIPRSSEEWNEYFIGKYGADNVERVIKERVSKAESVLGKIDFSKLDNKGVKDLINDINKSTLSEEDKIIASIEIYDKAIESGIKVDIQVIASPKFIDSSGKIKWPEECGYTINPITGKAIKYEVVLKKGDIIDRYGAPNGTFTSPIIDGMSIPYEQRSLPYLDNKNAYHQYEITRDFNELSEVIKNCKDKDLVELINADALRYGIDLDNLKTYGGEIAPAFDAIGGGTQFQLPLSVDYLIKLGFLKEIK